MCIRDSCRAVWIPDRIVGVIAADEFEIVECLRIFGLLQYDSIIRGVRKPKLGCLGHIEDIRDEVLQLRRMVLQYLIVQCRTIKSNAVAGVEDLLVSGILPVAGQAIGVDLGLSLIHI